MTDFTKEAIYYANAVLISMAAWIAAAYKRPEDLTSLFVFYVFMVVAVYFVTTGERHARWFMIWTIPAPGNLIVMLLTLFYLLGYTFYREYSDSQRRPNDATYD